MRLSVQPLQQITPALCQDLAKLPLPEGVDDIESWLQEQQSDVWLATFNAKYIGLLLLSSRQQQLHIDWLVVREATRRRGVGRYLLEQAIAAYPDKETVVAGKDGAIPQLQQYGFLTALGFSDQGHGRWLKAW
ncbi:aspartate 1-decarboxylase autocleavage activator PanM [Neiella sp. HB171785]|uniref:Aspartate 1-decarboxylase autocleavage activator PanM n=1 Tax=Neiella litorisoli TaxID=2771431 RepID=A0A8J6UJ96_9GAMM|nr:aspartate 1-decarboxylase autocleavage activator PanM [Neiella litorisoli]MBD1390198.1 aspartate 1-decarboxylase autocleavage activator PanM [Neiella litorisoli]